MNKLITLEILVYIKFLNSDCIWMQGASTTWILIRFVHIVIALIIVNKKNCANNEETNEFISDP